MRALCWSWMGLIVCGAVAHADGTSPPAAQVRQARLLESPDVPLRALGQGSDRLVLFSRDQLINERRRLQEELPGLGGPIAVTCVGGGGLLLGGLYLWLGLSIRTGLSSVGSFVTLGVLGLAVGGVAAVAGILWILSRLSDREPIQAQLKEIDHRLDEVYERAPLPAPPPQDFPPPPPPPTPPPAVLGPTPVPMTLLARF